MVKLFLSVSGMPWSQEARNRLARVLPGWIVQCNLIIFKRTTGPHDIVSDRCVGYNTAYTLVKERRDVVEVHGVSAGRFWSTLEKLGGASPKRAHEMAAAKILSQLMPQARGPGIPIIFDQQNLAPIIIDN